MTSTSDGSQAEEQAKVFARQYAKEFQAEKEAPINELVKNNNKSNAEKKILLREKILKKLDIL